MYRKWARTEYQPKWTTEETNKYNPTPRQQTIETFWNSTKWRCRILFVEFFFLTPAEIRQDRFVEFRHTYVTRKFTHFFFLDIVVTMQLTTVLGLTGIMILLQMLDTMEMSSQWLAACWYCQMWRPMQLWYKGKNWLDRILCAKSDYWKLPRNSRLTLGQYIRPGELCFFPPKGASIPPCLGTELAVTCEFYSPTWSTFHLSYQALAFWTDLDALA